MRGADIENVSTAHALEGLFPHGRGRLPGDHPVGQPVGAIPACAGADPLPPSRRLGLSGRTGLTSAPRRRCGWRRGYPRMCGADVIHGYVPLDMEELYPRARGRLGGADAQVDHDGAISAGAGPTVPAS